MTESGLHEKGAAESGAARESSAVVGIPPGQPAAWTLVSAVNNEQVLGSCLFASPDSRTASEVILQKGYTSAAVAYNDALARAKTDLVVFIHQDVYLPSGWTNQFRNALAVLSNLDPQWAVLGVWGIDEAGRGVGHIYCAGVRKTLGAKFQEVKEVRSLDEVILIVRKSSGVRFDETVTGFHMYGTDICLEAKSRGMKCYAISAFCIHNTNGYRMLPWQFWKAYFIMRRKWRNELPITTTCAQITNWCWPMIYWNLNRSANLLLGRHKPGRRVSDPSQLYREHLAPGSLPGETGEHPERPAGVN